MSQSDFTLSPAPAGFRLVGVVLGLVLLAAAAMKAHALWVGPAPPLSLFSSPRWQVGFIELETVLGLWLLSGVNPRGAWLAALGAFALFAGVSLYLVVVGSPSCGCFDRVSVNPWVTLALDVAAVLALWRWRPRPLVSLGSTRGQLYVGLGLTVLLVVGSVAPARIDEAPSAAVARLRGESLVIEPPVADLGSGMRGERRETVTPGTCNGDDCEVGNCFNNANVDPDNGCQGGDLRHHFPPLISARPGPGSWFC